MSDKTISEIQEHYGREASEILTRYHETIDEIKADRDLEPSPYLERLTEAGRFESLREQKERQVDQERARVIPEYRENREIYRDAVLARTAHLKRELFGEPTSERVERLALASDEELARLMDRAAFTENGELARAVFMEAHHREDAALMGRYFEMSPASRDLYDEWREAPRPEALERQIEATEKIIHRPSADDLMPRVGASV